MTAEIVNKYIGKDYEFGAHGPDSFDCRGLLVTIQRDEFGKDFPDLPNGDEMRALYAGRLLDGLWTLVDVPRHGDGAILRGGDQPHVGVYLTVAEGDTGVVHALEGVGVVWTNTFNLRRQGFTRVQYIRFHEGQKNV